MAERADTKAGLLPNAGSGGEGMNMRIFFLLIFFLGLVLIPVQAYSVLSEKAYDRMNLPRLSLPLPDEPLVIAVIDDAFNLNHDQLKGMIYHNKDEIPGNHRDDDQNGYADDITGWDFGDYDNDVTVNERNKLKQYHGTMVAGIVAKSLEYSLGNSASSHARIMPLKVLPDQFSKPDYSNGYPAFKYALEQKVDIIILAWSGGEAPQEFLPLFHKALQQGTAVFAAAGNAFSDHLTPPASLDPVFAVAAVDSTLRKVENSNYSHEVDLSAYGQGVKAPHSFADSAWFPAKNTSAAVALVGGAAAVIKAAHPAVSPYNLYEALRNTAIPIDSFNITYATQLGAGVPDVKAAIGYVKNASARHKYYRPDRPKGILTLGGGNLPDHYTLNPYGGIKGFRFQLVGRQSLEPGAELKLSYNDSLLSVYSGDSIPLQWFTASQRITLSCSGKTKKPVSLKYQAIHVDSTSMYCSGIQYLKQDSGVISDGSVKNKYTNNASCKWQITVDSAKRVKLVFEKMDTQANVDYVYLFNGHKTIQKNLLAKFSGNNPPPVIVSPSNRVLVWFVTDSSVTKQGWKLNFRAVDKPPGFQLRKDNM